MFVANPAEREVAEAEVSAIETSGVLGAPVVTKIVDAATFWPAEDYHQDYYRKNPVRYKFYRYSCGRDQRLETLWGMAH